MLDEVVRTEWAFEFRDAMVKVQTKQPSTRSESERYLECLHYEISRNRTKERTQKRQELLDRLTSEEKGLLFGDTGAAVED